MLILFDTLGTLFSFDKLKDKFQERGIPVELMELWITRLFNAAIAFTLVRKQAVFRTLAHTTLKQILRQQNIKEGHVDELLKTLDRIEPWDDADECLHALRSQGHRLVAVTNSGREDAGRLLKGSGLWKWFERLYSAEIAKACKHHRTLYEFLFRTMFAAPYECCLVSAHASDILGAEAVGMNTVYITRLEKVWPFPDAPSAFIVSTLREVPAVISGAFGKPADAIETSPDGINLKWYGEA